MKKISLVVISLVCFGVSCLGQVTSRVLGINRIAQETPNWCWAATMQMAINYYRPASSRITQSDLAILNGNVKIRQALGIPPTSLSPVEISRADVSRLFSKVCCDDKPNYRCILPSTGIYTHDNLKWDGYLSDISSYNGVEETQAFDNLFSNLDYNSIQDAKAITWEDISKQIEKGKPVIIIEGLTGSSGTHAVLAVGYYLIDVPPQKFKLLAINNPLIPNGKCNVSDFYLVNESYFKVDYTFGGIGGLTKPPIIIDNKRKIYSVVKEISPKNSPDCISTISNFSSNTEFENLVTQFIKPDTSNAANAQVRYICSKELLKINPITGSSNLLSGSVISKILYDNVSIIKNKKNLTYLFDKFDKEIILSKVIQDSTFNLEPKVLLNNGLTLWLSNNGEGAKYDIIEYPLFGYRFFRFPFKGQWYLSPFYTYFLGNNKFEQNIAFSEGEILKKLKEETLNKEPPLKYFNEVFKNGMLRKKKKV